MEELDEHASRRDAMVEEDASVHSWWRVLMLSSRLSLPTGSHVSLTQLHLRVEIRGNRVVLASIRGAAA
ncbi:hypothetical protein [Ktedonobacter robiniae]|uniref:hypothetical protein n=1 Tax=Ktedonobacter robiniae TaxID=2778365 RepID=UPI00191578D4|nr:hypothetical protein [Ktedonobacter robiniae]